MNITIESPINDVTSSQYQGVNPHPVTQCDYQREDRAENADLHSGTGRHLETGREGYTSVEVADDDDGKERHNSRIEQETQNGIKNR